MQLLYGPPILGPLVSDGFFSRLSKPVLEMMNSTGVPLISSASSSTRVETTPQQPSRKIITPRDLTPRDPIGDFLLQDYQLDDDGNLWFTIADQDGIRQITISHEQIKTFQKIGQPRLRFVHPERINGFRGKIIRTLKHPIETWTATLSISGALTAIGSILLAIITGFPWGGTVSDFFLTVGAFAFQVSWISGGLFLIATGTRRALQLQGCTDFSATILGETFTFDGCIPVKHADKISELHE